jgi:hypothetical protein
MPTPANGNASEKFRLPTTGVPLPLGKFLGLSGILTEESFAIREILLVSPGEAQLRKLRKIGASTHQFPPIL